MSDTIKTEDGSFHFPGKIVTWNNHLFGANHSDGTVTVTLRRPDYVMPHLNQRDADALARYLSRLKW